MFNKQAVSFYNLNFRVFEKNCLKIHIFSFNVHYGVKAFFFIIGEKIVYERPIAVNIL